MICDRDLAALKHLETELSEANHKYEIALIVIGEKEEEIEVRRRKLQFGRKKERNRKGQRIGRKRKRKGRRGKRGI